MRKVYSFNPSNGMSNQLAHFLIGNIDQALPQQQFDQDEVKETAWFSASEIRQLLSENKINDGASVLPLAMHFAGLT